MDLKFPHHECEIAQNVGATGSEPVRYWIHGNMLTVNGRKMAKSEGNGFTPEELITGNHQLLERGYSPMTVRFFMLQCHYASTLDFSNEALQASEKGLRRLLNAVETLEKISPSSVSEYDTAALQKRCVEAMNDDFNTPILISELFEGVKVINQAKDGSTKLSAEDIALLKQLYADYVYKVLGIREESESTGNDLSEGLMQLIINLRADAKARKDFGTADTIRDGLSSLSVTLKDSKEGTTWEHGN
jgi:cysteinyl-tRNA synthetase